MNPTDWNVLLALMVAIGAVAFAIPEVLGGRRMRASVILPCLLVGGAAAFYALRVLAGLMPR